MSFYKTSRFWEGVAASLVAALIWWIGGRVLDPVGARLFMTSWPPLMEWLHEAGWLLLLIGAALLYVNRRSASAPASEPTSPYPRLEIFRHTDSQDQQLFMKVRSLFMEAGWRLEFSHSNQPQHAKGLWIHGGTSPERAAATWALQTLGITPKIDYRDDNPPSLQIIVGQIEPSQNVQTVPVKPFAASAPTRDAAANAPLGRPTDLKGELEVRLHPEGNELHREVKNINPVPKTEIHAFLDDLRRWAPAVHTFVEVASVADSPRPLALQLRAGTPKVFYDQKLSYSLFPQVDKNCSILIPYRRKDTLEQIRIMKGLWLCRVRVTWNDRAHIEEYFVRFDRPHVAPEIVPDPRG